MNELQIFKNEKFGEIRTVNVDGEPWFVGKDVADNLGYQNGSRDVSRHVDDDDRRVISLFDGTQNRDSIIINESGLYSLVLSSKLESAKQFKRWITNEVIPSIRKNGGYINGQSTMTDAELLAKAVLVANKTIEERNARIGELEARAAQDRPKVLFADSVSASDKSILVGELAKLIKQNGVDIGQNRLFQWLRNNGYLIRRQGADYNMPTQYSMERGWFEIKETSVVHADGHTSINKTPKVTGKGQIYFVNRFLDSK